MTCVLSTLDSPASSSCHVLIPHLVFLEDFEQVQSIGGLLGKDWRELLADCFPKLMVNILPYFVLSGQDAQVAQEEGEGPQGVRVAEGPLPAWGNRSASLVFSFFKTLQDLTLTFSLRKERH